MIRQKKLEVFRAGEFWSFIYDWLWDSVKIIEKNVEGPYDFLEVAVKPGAFWNPLTSNRKLRGNLRLQESRHGSKFQFFPILGKVF